MDNGIVQSARQRSERILIVDDDTGVVALVSDHLRRAGYQVLTASDGEAALALAHDAHPEMALVGLVLPDGSGLGVCRALVGQPVPPTVFVLASVADRETRMAALAAGADELVAKPFDPIDLVARVGAHLSASNHRDPLHPLTSLPFRGTLNAEMQARLDQRASFRLLLIDLNGLRGYNATHGLARGDEAIRRLAQVVREVVGLIGTPEDLVGHADEDDLAVLTTAPAAPLCSRIIARFDTIAGDLYGAEDRQRGYSLSLDRQGQSVRHPLLRVSIGVVESETFPGAHPVELWQAANDVLAYARTLPGSAVHVDQRRTRSPGGSPFLPAPRDVREARGHGLARAVDASVLGLVTANLRAGLTELGRQADEPGARAAAVERLRGQIAIIESHIQAAQGWRGFTPTPLDFASLLDETLRGARPVAAARAVGLTVAGTPPTTLMVVDGEKLVTGLRAVLVGLANFTLPGGQIEVQALGERGRIVLEVRADRPTGDRAALLAGLRTPATAEPGPLSDLGLGRGLLAVLGASVEPGPVTSEECRLTLALPSHWHTSLDSVNALEQALDDLYGAVRAEVQALEDGLLAWEMSQGEPVEAGETADTAMDDLRAHLAELQGGIKRLLVTGNQLALLADEAAIECARATEALAQVEADYLTTIEGLVEALESHSPDRRGHGRRAASLAVALGRRLRLSQAELTTLYRAGLLADVGLALLDADLLNRPGPLTAEERLAIHGHPTASLRLVRGIGLLAPTLPAIAAHHERYDGTGYPAGWSGATIPLAARVLAVADAAVAMLSPRPYRPALTLEAVEAQLVAGAGAHFDPTVVDAARALLMDGSLARLVGAPLAGAPR